MEYKIINCYPQKVLKLNTQSIETMKRGCTILDFFKVKYWLGGGTALGIYRDNDFIKEDTDIDVEVYDAQEQIDLIEHIFQSEGFSLVRKVIGEDNTINQVAYWDNKNETLFDINLYKQDVGYITYWSEGLGLLKLPESFLQLISDIEFKGKKYPMINPDIYLPWVFGKSWKTPVNKKETIYNYGKE